MRRRRTRRTWQKQSEALIGAERFAGTNSSWTRSCSRWCLSYFCCGVFDKKYDPGYQSLERLRSLQPSCISLGRPGYTDLSKLHDVGSYDLRNWAITKEMDIKIDAIDLLNLTKPELKTALRRGIPSIQRPDTWPKLVCNRMDSKIVQNMPQYTELLYEVFYGQIPHHCSKEVQVPDFGGALMFGAHPVTAEGREEVKQVLCVVKHHFGAQLVYCPVLPDLTAILLHYVTPEIAFKMLASMIERSEVDNWHFAVNGFDFELEAKNFLHILPSILPTLTRHINRVGFNLEDSIKVWFGRFFVSFLPYDTVLRLMDVYLNEGSKTLFRAALGVLRIHQEELLQCTSAERISYLLAKNMRTKTDTDELFSLAFKFKIHRRQFQAQIEPGKICQIPVASVQVFHVPKYTQEKYNLMTVSQCRRLWTYLPPLLRVMDPDLRYASYRDGFNLSGVLRCMLAAKREQRPTILLVQDARAHLFGAVLDWREDSVAGKDTFLFTLKPHAHQYPLRVAPRPLRQMSDMEGEAAAAARVNEPAVSPPKAPPNALRMHTLPSQLASVSSLSKVKESNRIYRNSSNEPSANDDIEITPTSARQSKRSTSSRILLRDSPTHELRRIFPQGMVRLNMSKEELEDRIEDNNRRYNTADPPCIGSARGSSRLAYKQEASKASASNSRRHVPESKDRTLTSTEDDTSPYSRENGINHHNFVNAAAAKEAEQCALADSAGGHLNTSIASARLDISPAHQYREIGDGIKGFGGSEGDGRGKASSPSREVAIDVKSDIDNDRYGNQYKGSSDNVDRSIKSDADQNKGVAYLPIDRAATGQCPFYRYSKSIHRESEDSKDSFRGSGRIEPSDSTSNSIYQSVSYLTFDSLRKRERKSRSSTFGRDKELFRDLIAKTLSFIPVRNSKVMKMPRLQITSDHLLLTCDGRVALALNSDLSVGFSHRTLGWRNPPLTKVDPLDHSFEVRHVELWGFEGY
eukprot:CAMPEP_0184481460 /NCGR_PEP_ID=MMETSP0113_2-20130426/2996_1 /TAXON_ID=91329 /ORGANISM="Norrisiella sphaerica, Strain BC52" /LENGTH=972 /DNA_ID=CAMNT_0026860591 /DNA_START=81 /DNA_END=3002 /DNA_ORIENTATION=+